MTYQIAKSVVDRLPYNFADEVEKHRQALLAHRFTGDAAPTAPAIIERAVTRVQQEDLPDDFVVAFEVIDDTPPPPVPPTPAELRSRLIGTVRTLEMEASAKVIGPGKARLLNMEVAPIYAKTKTKRTEADKAKLAEMEDVQRRLRAVQLHAAQVEAQIDDLPDDQIEGWQVPAFPVA